MAKQQVSPFEGIAILVLSTVSEIGAESMFQKMIDKDKAKAKIVLNTLKSAIQDVAKANKIKLV